MKSQSLNWKSWETTFSQKGGEILLIQFTIQNKNPDEKQ